MGYNSNVDIKKVFQTGIRSYYTGLIHMAINNREDLTEDAFNSVVQLASYMLVSADKALAGAPAKAIKDMAKVANSGFYDIIERTDVEDDAAFEAAIRKLLDIMYDNLDVPIHYPSAPTTQLRSFRP